MYNELELGRGYYSVILRHKVAKPGFAPDSGTWPMILGYLSNFSEPLSSSSIKIYLIIPYDEIAMMIKRVKICGTFSIYSVACAQLIVARKQKRH